MDNYLCITLYFVVPGDFWPWQLMVLDSGRDSFSALGKPPRTCL